MTEAREFGRRQWTAFGDETPGGPAEVVWIIAEKLFFHGYDGQDTPIAMPEGVTALGAFEAGSAIEKNFFRGMRG